MTTKTCPICGEEFQGGNRAIYCPDCRGRRRKETQEAYRRIRGMRAIGSEQTCQNCGKPFILANGKQKYCAECSAAAMAQQIEKANQNYKRKKQKRPVSDIPQSGIEGITWSRLRNKWMLKIDGRHFGLYKTVEEADKARRFYESVLTCKGGTIRQMTVREMRKVSGLTQDQFGSKYHIPVSTLGNWELNITAPPAYVLELLQRAVLEDVKEETLG